ncbi:iron chelate uptake ABC transporter family permease subunit, partial [Nonomuraea rhizosphaerae]|uniref:iron chelate uptake ABC transporter family permease subunit n=1 Tax=Nonomuraea rhizosphaerae TaxID=2665663 RepID=UPI001FEB852F
MGPWSARLAPRAMAVGMLLLLAAFAVSVAAIATGEFTVSVPDVLSALFGQGTPVAELIVSKLRAPRVVTGLLVGAAFGLSGAIFQSLTRNPLGSPDFIGFTAGASTGGILGVVAGGTAAQISG